jgi:Ca2+-binding EF-hand superfamily protein
MLIRYSSGKNPTDQYLEEMMNCAPGPINFTMFLTMFGEKLNGTDPEDVIKNAFACFDEDASGESATVVRIALRDVINIKVFRIASCDVINI